MPDFYDLIMLIGGFRNRDMSVSPEEYWLRVAIFMYAIAICYIAVRWLNYKSPKSLWAPGPVSVIICARNEEENLRLNLPEVLRQQYSQFEVIVVNDRSTDGTAQVLAGFQKNYPRLKVVEITGEEGSKKQALDAGIKASSHDIILLTDADCKPATPYWIAHMATFFDAKTDIVLGFSPYNKHLGLLNMLIRYETLFTAYLYGGLAMMGLPYMGVGRNLAYRKKVYLDSTAKDTFSNVLSGDDDLLVNEMARGQNTRVCAESDALTWSEPETSWSAWWHQKRRHREAGKHYRQRTKLLLGFIYIPQMLFYAGLIAYIIIGLINGTAIGPMVFMLLLIRFIMLVILLPATMNVLEQASLLPFVLICDFLLSVILFTLGCLSVIKVGTWSNNHPRNGRKTT